MAGRTPKAAQTPAQEVVASAPLAPLEIAARAPYVIMTIEVEPKVAVLVKAHDFKSTSRGYQLRGERAVINGRKYMVQVDLIEIGSKTVESTPPK